MLLTPLSSGGRPLILSHNLFLTQRILVCIMLDVLVKPLCKPILCRQTLVTCNGLVIPPRLCNSRLLSRTVVTPPVRPLCNVCSVILLRLQLRINSRTCVLLVSWFEVRVSRKRTNSRLPSGTSCLTHKPCKLSELVSAELFVVTVSVPVVRMTMWRALQVRSLLVLHYNTTRQLLCVTIRL